MANKHFGFSNLFLILKTQVWCEKMPTNIVKYNQNPKLTRITLKIIPNQTLLSYHIGILFVSSWCPFWCIHKVPKTHDQTQKFNVGFPKGVANTNCFSIIGCPTWIEVLGFKGFRVLGYKFWGFNTWSHCNVVFSNPFSIEFPIFSSLKVFYDFSKSPLQKRNYVKLFSSRYKFASTQQQE